jgi:hypothetical protein
VPFNQPHPYPSIVVNAAVATGIPSALLAHQGGWDEILLIAGPIVVVVGLLALARRRVTRHRGSEPTHDEPSALRQ